MSWPFRAIAVCRKTLIFIGSIELSFAKIGIKLVSEGPARPRLLSQDCEWSESLMDPILATSQPTNCDILLLNTFYIYTNEFSCKRNGIQIKFRMENHLQLSQIVSDCRIPGRFVDIWTAVISRQDAIENHQITREQNWTNLRKIGSFISYFRKQRLIVSS